MEIESGQPLPYESEISTGPSRREIRHPPRIIFKAHRGPNPFPDRHIDRAPGRAGSLFEPDWRKVLNRRGPNADN